MFGCAGLTLRVTFGKWHADAPHPLGVLRTRSERRRRHTDKETDELAPLHACLPNSGGHRKDEIGILEGFSNVRFGSKADICDAIRHVRSTPESGHVRRTSRCLLSANSESNTLHYNHALMSSFAFWLYVNTDSAISNILVQSSFQAITNNMCIRDCHSTWDN